MRPTLSARATRDPRLPARTNLVLDVSMSRFVVPAAAARALRAADTAPGISELPVSVGCPNADSAPSGLRDYYCG